MKKVKLYFAGLFNALMGSYPHEEMKRLQELEAREKLWEELRKQMLPMKNAYLMAEAPSHPPPRVLRSTTEGIEPIRMTFMPRPDSDCIFSDLQRQLYDNTHHQGDEKEHHF